MVPFPSFVVHESLGIEGTYQTLSLGPEAHFEPEALAACLLPRLDRQRGVIISGKAPVWLYSYWVGQLGAWPWVACFDPKLSGAVVVSSRATAWPVGGGDSNSV